MRDMRYDMGMDGRRLPPRNSRGEFRRRRSRRDRAMDGRDMGDYGDMARGRGRDYGDYGNDMARGYDRAGQDYGMDGHYVPHHRQGGYEPIEDMGYFTGYYGSPEDYGDMARGRGRDYGDYRGRDYGYDMRGGRDYGGRMYYGDYGYRDYGDYGETLTTQELDKWCQKLKSELNEQERQMFSKEAIMQKAKQMGKPMEGFGEKELETAVLMVYTDYKHTIGMNPDMAIKLAFDWLNDKDVAVKGAEKLAVYYDNIVEGE